MPHDPYALLHALLRAEAVRNEKSHPPKRREQPPADAPRPQPPARDTGEQPR